MEQKHAMGKFTTIKQIKAPKFTSHEETAAFILDVISKQQDEFCEIIRSLYDDILKARLGFECAIALLCERLDIDGEELWKEAAALKEEKWPGVLKKYQDHASVVDLINSVFKKDS